MRKVKYIFCLLVCCLAITATAKNLGTWGQVYPIGEMDFLQFIHSRLHHLQMTGELANMKNQFIKRVKEHVLRPTPVSWITPAKKNRTFYYDPTFVLNKNITDARGNVLFKAGKRINPLDTIKLSKVLIFLNADRKIEIKWALQEVNKFNFVKFILVNGNIKNATNALNNRVYFDQGGFLVKKLGILHTPCLVQQSGKRLELQEFKLTKRV